MNQQSQLELLEESNNSNIYQSDLNQSKWTIEDSKKLYQIEGWGEPYFSINAEGNVTVSPLGDACRLDEVNNYLDLYELVRSLQKRRIELPVLIRFSDILGDRLGRLHACMGEAIARYEYPNRYQGVFPIKCNQHRHLVQSLVKFGRDYDFGLEAGSKPELIIALAALESSSNGQSAPLLICNGYKDREYIETALLAQRLGIRAVVVIEQRDELDLVVDTAQKLGIRPIIGVRAKLSSKGVGRWGGSSGDRAKFGLTIPQIVSVVQQLEALEMLDCLQLLHFHIGSQISSISTIKDAIREASQIYVQLAKLGAAMGYLDVGGGLAVDYDGSKTKFYASKNYNMQNYANDIVAEVKEACEAVNIDAPVLVSESGRAIASHQSVLVFDVLGTNEVDADVDPTPATRSEHLLIRNLWETYSGIDADNYQEAYHDAIQFKEEAVSLFNFGYFSLRDRARAEQLYWACCQKILATIEDLDYIPDDLEELPKQMASIYYANLSIFQSAPDAWAIDQLFPIMPIHRLNEQPTARGVLADLTCDSDGKIDRFIDRKNVKDILELHPLQPQSNLAQGSDRSFQPYYLGMFLVGAYQETMGNLHNLFGDTNVVHVQITPKGYQIEYLVGGDTIREVLGYVQYDVDDLVETMRLSTEKALQEQRITIEEAQKLLQNYQRSLDSYTYLRK